MINLRFLTCLEAAYETLTMFPAGMEGQKMAATLYSKKLGTVLWMAITGREKCAGYLQPLQYSLLLQACRGFTSLFYEQRRKFSKCFERSRRRTKIRFQWNPMSDARAKFQALQLITGFGKFS